MSNVPGNITLGSDGQATGPIGSIGDAGDGAGGSDGGGFGDNIVIDPSTVGKSAAGNVGGDTGPATGRKRGRPRGSGKTSAKAAALPVEGIAQALFGIHAMLASMSGTPEWAIDNEEAKLIANTSANVSRHYGAEMTQKAMDWTNLLAALGMVYGTRVFAIRTRKADERAQARRNGTVGMQHPNVAPVADTMNGAGAFPAPPPRPPGMH